jgi:uncharacterized protein YrrD
MLRQFSHFKNFALAATDGEIGKIKELYFDDQRWIVRYVVVNTGGWLTGRKVLLPPQTLGLIDDEKELIAVHLTKTQVEQSPSIDYDKPISRRYEEEWHRYYGYSGYWLTPGPVAFGAAISGAEFQPAEPPRKSEGPKVDPHLRSSTDVTGYSIHASDGDIGHVDDFIVDDGEWTILYIVISRSFWAGKKVLISPDWIERISWHEMKVFVPLSRDTIRDAPEWDDSQPISREFEGQLFDYYGRRGIGRSRFDQPV